ncbi:MAG: hypothetical protein ACOY2B_07810 [Pseudomonadota bacterium]
MKDISWYIFRYIRPSMKNQDAAECWVPRAKAPEHCAQSADDKKLKNAISGADGNQDKIKIRTKLYCSNPGNIGIKSVGQK